MPVELALGVGEVCRGQRGPGGRCPAFLLQLHLRPSSCQSSRRRNPFSVGTSAIGEDREGSILERLKNDALHRETIRTACALSGLVR